MALFESDFHIVPCEKQKCKDRLAALVSELKEEGKRLKVVDHYSCSDSFEKSFNDAYTSSAFTIVHRCRDLYEKLKSFKEPFVQNGSRIMCISFDFDGKREMEQFHEHLKFFSGLNVTNASAISSRKAFAKKAVETLRKNHAKSSPVEEDEDVRSPDKFVKFPDTYTANRSIDVFVLKSFLKPTYSSANEKSPVEVYSELSQQIKNKEELSKLKHIVFEVLPSLYSNNDLVGLANFATSHHIEVANSATLILQLSLLKPSSSVPKKRFNQLVVVESILWRRLLMKNSDLDGEDLRREVVELYFRLAISYVMVLCEFVLTCVTDKKFSLGSTHLETLRGRSIPKTLTGDENIKKILDWLNPFVEDLCQRTCHQYNKELKNLHIDDDDVYDLDDADELKQFKELISDVFNSSVAVQTLLSYKTVKEVFKSFSSSEDLMYLKLFVELKTKADGSQPVSAFLSILLILYALTLNLVFELRNVTAVKTTQFCEEVMAIKTLICEAPGFKEMEENMKPLLQMLIFNSNPEIRKRKEAINPQKKIILKAVKKSLFPLLSEREPAAKTLQKLCESAPVWFCHEGTFGDQNVRLHLHVPLPDDHKTKFKTHFTDLDVYYNEIDVLQKFQEHKHIVRLLAFQKQCTPQFYIMEDFPILQEVLHNKQIAQDCFTNHTLEDFLRQAYDAVQFCHARGIIHCNLTAKSLLLVKDDFVKLGGFHLCLQLRNGKAKGNESNKNNTSLIRWSAPESIMDNDYSAASDVWMFGHLIYEVLTHGGQPYGSVPNDSDLTKKVVAGEVCLEIKKLFTKGQHSLIMKCAGLEPSDRPSLIEVGRELSVLANPSNPNLSTERRLGYDDFSDGHVPSTEHERGPPIPIDLPEDLSNGLEVQHLEHITDTIIKEAYLEKYSFREKLVSMSREVINRLSDGELQDILPYLTIKDTGREMAQAVIDIPRLNDEDQVKEASLARITSDKMLGVDVARYVECLHQVALCLRELHSRSWFLGDLCANHVQVQIKEDEEPKIYLISVGHMGYQSDEADSTASGEAPSDNLILVRAAPEVAQEGIYSLNSDIYCFGNMLWETLTIFDGQGNPYTNSKSYKAEELAKGWRSTHKKPDCCPETLYKFMCKCTQPNLLGRPSAAELIEELKRILHELQ